MMLLLLLSLQSFANPDPTLAVQQKTQLQTRQLEKTKGPDNFCVEDISKLEFIHDEGNVLLRIGEKFTLANLEQDESKHEAAENCLNVVHNTLALHHIHQILD